MTSRPAEVLINEWKKTRFLTEDMVRTLSLEELNDELPRPGLNTLAKHIVELCLVQDAFVAVLRGSELDFSEVQGITFGTVEFTAESCQQLLDMLKASESRLNETVQSIDSWDAEVTMFGDAVPKYAVLEFLIRHETLHHGQFIAFLYSKSIRLPESMVAAWALPVE